MNFLLKEDINCSYFRLWFSESYEENDHLFESLVALEEFCKELAAIAFVSIINNRFGIILIYY